MYKTNLDEIVEYPLKAIQKIGTDPTVAGLILNENLDTVTDDIADEILTENIFDYGYVDGVTTEATAYIFVEAEVARQPGATTKNMNLYVRVLCHKQFMKIDPTKFTGITGNRRDNLVRYIDALLEGSDIFGIGALKLQSVSTVAAPTGFAAREMTYSVPDFQKKGVVWNDA